MDRPPSRRAAAGRPHLPNRPVALPRRAGSLLVSSVASSVAPTAGRREGESDQAEAEQARAATGRGQRRVTRGDQVAVRVARVGRGLELDVTDRGRPGATGLVERDLDGPGLPLVVLDAVDVRRALPVHGLPDRGEEAFHLQPDRRVDVVQLRRRAVDDAVAAAIRRRL